MLNRENFAMIVNATRNDKNELSRYEKVAKLIEEVGELAKAILAQDEKVKITSDMEPPMGEIADVILMLIDIAQNCYPNISGESIYTQLQFKINGKFNKWSLYMEPKEKIDFTN